MLPARRRQVNAQARRSTDRAPGAIHDNGGRDFPQPSEPPFQPSGRSLALDSRFSGRGGILIALGLGDTINIIMGPDLLPQEFGERSPVAVVAVAGSAGGIRAMPQILAGLPADFPAPILYCQHLNGSRCDLLQEVLQWPTFLRMRWARQPASGGYGLIPSAARKVPKSQLTDESDGGATSLAVFERRRFITTAIICGQSRCWVSPVD